MPSALIVARACQFWAVATLLGGGGFLLLSPRVQGAVTILRLASVVACISGAAWLALTLSDVTDDPGSIVRLDDWQAFFGTSFGLPWAVRGALLVVCLAAIPSRRPTPYLAVAVALAIDQAWLGHAAAGVGLAGMAMLVSYWAHVLAAFAWVGALVMLTAALRERDDAKAEAALALFSTTGLVLVAVVLASGVANAAFRVDATSQLASTAYGRLVGLKILLFLAMLVLAAFNRRALRRRPGERWGLRLRVAAETLLGLAVLSAAALLGVTPPPG